MRAFLLLALAFVFGCGSDKSDSAKTGSSGSATAAVDPDAPTQAELEVLASCNPERMRNLVQGFNTDRQYTAAIRAGTAFQKKCKRVSVLDWDILYALEAVERWKESEAITDRLVKEDPSDSDYWWWRAKDRRHTGNNEGAVVDVRQSLVDATSRSNGVQVDHLDGAAKLIKRRCETAFALRWLANVGVDLLDSAKRQFNEVYLDEGCKKLDGHGTLAWTTSGMKRTKLEGKIGGGGKKLVVMIDGGLGTTLVRADIADAAKLARGAPIEVLTPTGLGAGAASAVDVFVGTASALDVPIAIVDKLPEGIDVVIGLSFLWRFEVKRDDDDKFHATRPLEE
jgi:hypothetical protein